MTRTKPPIKKEETKSPVKKHITEVSYLNTEKKVPKPTNKPYRGYTKALSAEDTLVAQDYFIDLIQQDTFSLKEMLDAVGISEYVYYETWMKQLDFLEKLKKAKQQARENMAVIAKNSLRRLVEGYEATDVTVAEKLDKNGNIITTTSKTTKIFKPDTAAVIFTLTNVDPDNWKNRQQIAGNIEHTSTITFEDLADNMADLDDEQLKALKEISLTILDKKK